MSDMSESMSDRECQDLCGIEIVRSQCHYPCQVECVKSMSDLVCLSNRMSESWSDRVSEPMSGRMSESMSNRVSESMYVR